MFIVLSFCSLTSSQINPLFPALPTMCPFVIYSFKISLDVPNAIGSVVFPWKVVSLPEATLRGKILLPAAQSQSPDSVLTHTFKPENKDSIFTFSFLTLLCLPAPFFNAAGFTCRVLLPTGISSPQLHHCSTILGLLFAVLFFPDHTVAPVTL